MSAAISRPATTPDAPRRVDRILYAPIAAVGWVFLALLELAVGAVLFRRLRSHGATAFLWGLGLALFLWAGLRAVGVHQLNAILFALVAGAVIALVVYLRGSGLEGAPSEKPGV